MYVLHYKVEYLKASYLNIESLLQEVLPSPATFRGIHQISIRKTERYWSVLEDLSGTD
jgi:hypothetical protein